ncbi:MAG TPA: hypothetical protein VGK41_08870, partial [Solirubrobacterales bacterium]
SEPSVAVVKSTTLTPEQRTLRARVGAYALHAQGGTSTKAGTAAFLSRFVREVEEAAAAKGEQLTPTEVERRAQQARRAYFARLALASSRARSGKKKAGARGSDTELPAMEDTDAAGIHRPAA